MSHKDSTIGAYADSTSCSAVEWFDRALEAMDHGVACIDEDRDLPTVQRLSGELRREAQSLYTAVDRFHRKLRMLAGDEEDEPREATVPPLGYRHPGDDSRLHLPEAGR